MMAIAGGYTGPAISPTTVNNLDAAGWAPAVIFADAEDHHIGLRQLDGAAMQLRVDCRHRTHPACAVFGDSHLAIKRACTSRHRR